MTRRSGGVVLWLCASSLFARAGSAQGGPEPPSPPPPAPAAAQGPAPALPPPGLPPPAPPPAPPEIVRRPVELVPQLGIALPGCSSTSVPDDRCEGVQAGPTFGFAAFWRVSPYFAWGGGFDVAGFRYEPPESAGLSETQAGGAWIGLLGRVYLLTEGSLDPYLQLGLGGGALGTSGREPTGDTYEETGAGPALQLGGGIDFILSRRLKLGPALTYTRVLVDKIRRCRAGGDGDCTDIATDDADHLNAFLSITGRITIMIGDEL